ncbi:hypothetical protein Kpol_1053p25 [Vanderwaltozyma polyspora DSM 70294]|uniref:Uncharacterized protein n=1 Tax=Vanderwaltozyma polyspora (strain ATCC 22028 / DSM 70294 / BCRC 21397 / CBS 2163 / NBRC 10782 / NRRL Y-8283 / UCD 57-17) TaxID=436907 RepID=A7TN70_VANPO|nr:uncharacterized protein Kpol_1053p25 [Vanderwaltozyma polyspora DSM 70294]EDO16288.1 hypothetical protein Kpol_1053p25 [Vanderwaltozyma polyspora DSM 70294]
MMFGRRLGTRLYSSGGVTNDFLKQILLRAQEVTSKENMQLKKSKSSKPGKELSTKNSNRRNDRGGRPVRRNDDKSKTVSFRPKDKRSGSVQTSAKRNGMQHSDGKISQQKQFSKKNEKSASFKKLVSDDQLIDSFSTMKTFKPTNKKTDSSTRRNVVGGTKTIGEKSLGNVKVGDIRMKVVKKIKNDIYIPQQPTAVSLLKYYPKLASTANDRMISCAITSLNENNFPVNRPLNLGISRTSRGKSGSLINNLISTDISNLGSYNNNTSLVLRKEKLLKNIVLNNNNNENVNSIIAGRYQNLPTLNLQAFQAISKNEKKKYALVKNSNVVRLSLEQSDNRIPFGKKQQLLDVCSGIKPVSELTL